MTTKENNKMIKALFAEVSATSVVRWMGLNGFTTAEAVEVMGKLRPIVPFSIGRSTIVTQMSRGRRVVLAAVKLNGKQQKAVKQLLAA